MTLIDTQQSGLVSALRDAVEKRAKATVADGAPSGVDKDGSVQDRAGYDTVSLSDDGQVIVNLNRGAELAKEIKDAPIDENFATNLKQASNDVFNIYQRFGQFMRFIFNLWK